MSYLHSCQFVAVRLISALSTSYIWPLFNLPFSARSHFPILCGPLAMHVIYHHMMALKPIRVPNTLVGTIYYTHVALKKRDWRHLPHAAIQNKSWRTATAVVAGSTNRNKWRLKYLAYLNPKIENPLIYHSPKPWFFSVQEDMSGITSLE